MIDEQLSVPDECSPGTRGLDEIWDSPTPARFQLSRAFSLMRSTRSCGLLLRRAHLLSHARLSVLAATNKKLSRSLQALRDQE